MLILKLVYYRSFLLLCNMKHAYLIMAHNEWEVLNTLLQLLDDERNDIYLHIDRKVKVLPDLYPCQKAKVQLTSTRNDVHWGDITQVKTELMLFNAAHQNGPYAYYHLVSGVDLPLKSQGQIHQFFTDNQGKIFAGFFQGKYHENDTWRKVSKIYLLMGWNKKCPQVAAWKRAVGQITRHVFLKLQYAFNYCNKDLKDIEFKKGHQWASLTEEAVSLLLSKKDWIIKRFSTCSAPDEIYKQTVIWNSPLRDNLYNTTNDRLGAMRFIDWERGEPYAWQDSDVEELINSPYMFARKISGKQKILVQALLEHAK